jgi:hypothetical protein
MPVVRKYSSSSYTGGVLLCIHLSLFTCTHWYSAGCDVNCALGFFCSVACDVETVQKLAHTLLLRLLLLLLLTAATAAAPLKHAKLHTLGKTHIHIELHSSSSL